MLDSLVWCNCLAPKKTTPRKTLHRPTMYCTKLVARPKNPTNAIKRHQIECRRLIKSVPQLGDVARSGDVSCLGNSAVLVIIVCKCVCNDCTHNPADTSDSYAELSSVQKNSRLRRSVRPSLERRPTTPDISGVDYKFILA